MLNINKSTFSLIFLKLTGSGKNIYTKSSISYYIRPYALKDAEQVPKWDLI